MIAFGDDGAPILAIGPKFEDEETEPDDGRSAEAIPAMVDWLCHAASAREVGQRAIALSFLLRTPSGPRTLRDLADRLGVPLSRAHRLKQRLSDFKGEFARRRNT